MTFVFTSESGGNFPGAWAEAIPANRKTAARLTRERRMRVSGWRSMEGPCARESRHAPHVPVRGTWHDARTPDRGDAGSGDLLGRTGCTDRTKTTTTHRSAEC